MPARLILTTCLVTAVIVYLAVMRKLRYRRMRKLSSRYSSYSKPNACGAMTFQDAQTIVQDIANLEFPFTFEKALQFALFRTYGIPTISSLLVHTSLFSSPATASKRYADTAVLVADFVKGDWGGPRWLESLSRLNCIHAPYQLSGKISNEDMLYTLSLFTLEPIRWISRYEWRELNDLERCAIAVFWKGIGDAMGISYNGLASPKSDRDWRDGLHWLQEVAQWAEAYEIAHMVPEQSNHDLGEQTTDILLWIIPDVLKPLGKQAVCALMDTRLRASMMYPSPSSSVSSVVHATLHARRLFLRHLAPPRPDWMPSLVVTEEPDEKGNYFMVKYDSLPFYVKPTFWNRWLTPRAWISRMRSLPLPGDDGDKYEPSGYTPTTCGPAHGKQGQKAMEAKVANIGRMSCPIAFGPSLDAKNS